MCFLERASFPELLGWTTKKAPTTSGSSSRNGRRTPRVPCPGPIQGQVRRQAGPAEETEQDRGRKEEGKDRKGKSEIESVYYLLTSAHQAFPASL